MSVDAVTRQEMYLQYLAGDTSITLPEPVTRIEKYWWDIAKRIESGVGTGGGITVDSALSETSTNPVQNKVVSKRFCELSEQKADKSGMTLDKHTDGLIYLFVDGKPVGNGVEITGEVVEGDVIGTLDEDNNLLLSGNIANGIYQLKWLLEDGTYSDAGTLVVGEIQKDVYTVTNYLGGCTTSNAIAEIEEDASYSATITKDSEYDGRTKIYVTMGGVDISDTAVNGDDINISNVTGDVIISCVAYLADIRINSGGTTASPGNETTAIFPFKYGDTIRVKGVTITTNTQEAIRFFDSTQGLSTAKTAYMKDVFGVVSGTVISNKDISLSFSDTSVLDAFAYVRFTANEINSNSIIAVNQPIS